MPFGAEPHMTNEEIYALCDYIEKCQALNATLHGYVNDPVDVDSEECFV